MAENEKSNKRRSAARAKPARTAAGTVHAGSSVKSAPSTKREAAAANLQAKQQSKRARRQNEERILTLVDIITRQDEQYIRYRRIWWTMLITGFAAMILTLLFGQIGTTREGGPGIFAPLSMIGLILAYVLVIGAFVFDMVKIRPLRKDADARVRSMTEKKQERIIAEYELAEYERRRAKREAKEAKKG